MKLVEFLPLPRIWGHATETDRREEDDFEAFNRAADIASLRKRLATEVMTATERRQIERQIAALNSL